MTPMPPRPRRMYVHASSPDRHYHIMCSICDGFIQCATCFAPEIVAATNLLHIVNEHWPLVEAFRIQLTEGGPATYSEYLELFKSTQMDDDASRN